MLLYSTRKMENIVQTGSGFFEFSRKTSNLLLGSRLPNAKRKSVNVLDVIDFVSKKYPELRRAYDDLSETAHPNMDGLIYCYSSSHDEGMLTKFSDKRTWIYKDSQLPIMSLLLAIFEEEYNENWPNAFNSFEEWIDENDSILDSQ